MGRFWTLTVRSLTAQQGTPTPSGNIRITQAGITELLFHIVIYPHLHTSYFTFSSACPVVQSL